MDNLASQFFINNGQRKLAALIMAIILWLLVDHSITESKTIPNVPIRIINLPQDKTISGLLPNGVLQKRISLTLSGSKEVIDKLEPGDLEVVLDVSTANNDEWVIKLTKKNLVSLNPNLDIIHNITQVDHSEFIIKISRLVTAKIPITILPPVGDPPTGYEFLDIWPLKLTQTVSGPEDEVQKLKAKGFDLIFDLGDITAQDLDTIKSSPGNYHDDEIRYLVPSKWKQIMIPFHNNSMEEINDPEAQVLRIYFLRNQILPIDAKIPLSVYYPLQTAETLNPSTLKIASGKYVDMVHQVPVFKVPVFAKNVSRLFLNVIKDSLQITLTAASPKERQVLEWSLEVININALEDTYVAYLISQLSQGKNSPGALPKKREKVIRQRFREYLKKIKLYSSPEKKLHLESVVEDGNINIISY